MATAEPPGNGRRRRAGAKGLILALLLLDDPPLRECLAALVEEPATPKELVDRLGLNEDVVSECCRTLADCGLVERMG
jgi:predicted transcriptional regulator